MKSAPRAPPQLLQGVEMQAGGVCDEGGRRSHTRPRPYTYIYSASCAHTSSGSGFLRRAQRPRLHLRPALGRDGVQVFQMALADGPEAHEQNFQRFHHNSPLDTSGRPFVTMKPAPPGSARSRSSSASAPAASL